MSVTTTSTTPVLQEMVPGGKLCFQASDDFCSRVVRFDSECVLIPDRELRRPKVTRVYSLPLWKKRTGVSPGREVEVVEGGVSLTTEERVLFKVPIPRFISRSPSRGRTPSSSPPMKPLSPILVHRIPSSLPNPTIPRPLRRSSLPVEHCLKVNSDEITIPLRECCAACEAVTDECLQEGKHWHEKFTRAARRRRSSSLDNPNRPDVGDSSASSKYTFAGAISDPVPSNSRFGAPTFALTVDEVDKRRKSLDAVESELIRHSSSSSAGEGGSPPPTASSTISCSGESSIPAHRPKASPIEEEDEDQLFPLPSPRRSPASTPSVSPRNSPLPSPSASTSCLSPYRASRESLLRTWTTAEEDILNHSLSRVPNTPPRSLALPSTKPSGLALSIPRESSGSSTHSNASSNSSSSSNADRNATTSPGTPASAKPSLPPLIITSPSTPRKQLSTSPRTPTVNSGASPRTAKPRSSAPVPIPVSTPSKKDAATSISGSAQPDTTSQSPSTSASPLSRSPSQRRRTSLSLPHITGAIRDAGLEVLRGVTSFGSGSSGGTMIG